MNKQFSSANFINVTSMNAEGIVSARGLSLLEVPLLAVYDGLKTVMNTEAEIEQAYADYRAGLFGPT
jgi:redox-sensitive bicupin YhaK (pirin superfamily)